MDSALYKKTQRVIGKLHQQRLRAVVARKKLLQAKGGDHETNMALNEVLGWADCAPLHNVRDSLNMLGRLAPKWELSHFERIGKNDGFNKAVMKRTDYPDVKREGRKVSRVPQIALAALLMQLHIEDIDELLDQLQKRLDQYGEFAQTFSHELDDADQRYNLDVED